MSHVEPRRATELCRGLDGCIKMVAAASFRCVVYLMLLYSNSNGAWSSEVTYCFEK